MSEYQHLYEYLDMEESLLECQRDFLLRQLSSDPRIIKEVEDKISIIKEIIEVIYMYEGLQD